MGGEIPKGERISVVELDEILGTPLAVLDSGFVRLVDYMGSDAAIVQAARVSYGAGTKKVHEDRGLIRYLMRHRHTSPFEMCEIKLHVRVPMDCWRQWIRHRTANVNEYSTRYSVAIDAAQRTAPDGWRSQADRNRQGSGGFVDSRSGAQLTAEETALQDAARRVYESRLDLGVAREQARKDLPLATYTEAYWKIDLHNLFHFLELRLEDRAQYEIREYARVIGYELVAKWCPMAWEAFQDYRLNGVRLSALEASVVRLIASGRPRDASAALIERGLLDSDGRATRSNRERTELGAKLKDLGYTVPWTVESE